MNYLYIQKSELVTAISKSLPLTLSAVLLAPRTEEVLNDHNLKEGLVISCVVGNLGRGKVLVKSCKPDRIELEMQIDEPLPARLPLDLVVAYSRPQTIKKIIHLASSLGLNSLSFVKTANVVPSYLQSKSLDPIEIRRHLVLACEQAGDGDFPLVNHFRDFYQFLDSELLQQRSEHCFFGDIGTEVSPVQSFLGGQLLFLGPESGFILKEKQALLAAGFTPLSLGPRVLRLEVASAILIGKLL